MTSEQVTSAMLGPLGVAVAIALVLALSWPWLRRRPARARHRAVRVILTLIVLGGIAGTWAVPRTGGFGDRIIGRHGWLLLTPPHVAGGTRPAGGRVAGEALLATLIETGVMIVVAVCAHGVVRRRLVHLDAIRCRQCGYDLTRLETRRCPECGCDAPGASDPSTGWSASSEASPAGSD